MKKAKQTNKDEFAPHIGGQTSPRGSCGANMPNVSGNNRFVVLEPEVARAFPNQEAVNHATFVANRNCRKDCALKQVDVRKSGEPVSSMPIILPFRESIPDLQGPAVDSARCVYHHRRGTPMNAKLAIDKDRIADFCRRHHITRLAIFGSALRDDFRPDSDIDVLVSSSRAMYPDSSAYSTWRRSCQPCSTAARWTCEHPRT